MSFQQGLSGLNAAAKSLDVIGNNIANASTVGFKGSTTQFADVYANALNGAGGMTAGIGVKTAAIAQQFTQGNVEASSNPLDIAINGAGFFRIEQAG
ncbi:MAG: flagellar hook-basal body complex protein, partial [Oxalobacteraceae bacterium]